MRLSGGLAILCGLLFSPLAILAGLVVYGLSRDEESNSFGYILLWSGMVGIVVVPLLVLYCIGRFGATMGGGNVLP